jgi:hypothetical protein
MPERLSDTQPDAEKALIEVIRSMHFWQRIRLVDEMIMAGRALSMSGLRERFPEATSEELFRRLSTLLLGVELAAIVYGPEPFPPTIPR